MPLKMNDRELRQFANKRVVDGTQLYHDAIKRIQQLEALNATLAAEVDRQRPVVQAAIDMSEHGCGQCEAQLDAAITTYKASSHA